MWLRSELSALGECRVVSEGDELGRRPVALGCVLGRRRKRVSDFGVGRLPTFGGGPARRYRVSALRCE